MNATLLRRFAVVCLIATAAFAQSRPSPQDIMDRVVARVHQDEQQAKEGKDLVATEHSVQEDLNEDGSVKERTEFVREPVLIEGKVFLRTVSRNGQPLTGKYARTEKQREDKFREHLHDMRKVNEDEIKLDREFFSRFDLTNEGDANVNGRAAWIVGFEPKPGEKSERTRMEHVLNHVQGRIWVDEREYEIAKVDCTLTEPVSVYGILGKVRKLDFKLEQIERGGFWSPLHLQIAFDARAVVVTLRQRITNDYSNFRMKSELH